MITNSVVSKIPLFSRCIHSKYCVMILQSVKLLYTLQVCKYL